jgi:hypothetical protein
LIREWELKSLLIIWEMNISDTFLELTEEMINKDSP